LYIERSNGFFKNDRFISDRDSAELLQPGVQFRLPSSRDRVSRTHDAIIIDGIPNDFPFFFLIFNIG
jgi:hypothetical protein